ncbi:MAG: hypothetical protein JWO62_2318 [Acidimicrobiaceae bacterium]|nr:hypothetical protein [Acidimicrobiaceae bacterium]
MEDEGLALAHRDHPKCRDDRKVVVRGVFGGAVRATKRDFSAPTATLVERQVEQDSPRPGIRPLVAPDLRPVPPGLLERSLRKVLRILEIADEDERLPDEPVASSAKVGVERLLLLSVIGHRSSVRSPPKYTPETVERLRYRGDSSIDR